MAGNEQNHVAPFEQGFRTDTQGIAYFLEAASYDSIRDRMVYQHPHALDIYVGGLQPSFTDQMARVRSRGEPDAFLVTTNSAVPVADTIRGYYDALDIPHPYIGYVRADHVGSLTTYRAGRVQNESIRLQPLLAGFTRVCTVEQFVSRKVSLMLAREILQRVGIESMPEFSESNWYHDARADDIDLDGITSIHQPFMYEVGQLAAATPGHFIPLEQWSDHTGCSCHLESYQDV
jgi:hypothetical protein